MSKLDQAFRRLERQLDQMAKISETAIALGHKKVLEQLRANIGALYDQYENKGQLTMHEMAKYNRLKKLDKEVAEAITDLYKNNSQLIRGHLRTVASATSISTLEALEKATEKKLVGIIKEVEVTKTINERMAGLAWPERIGKHRDDVIWNIQKEIKQGLSAGETYGAMSKRLKKELEVSTSKATQIIRTEGHRVQAQAKIDTLDSIADQGVKMTKRWLSSKDERVRSQHAAMDGVTVDYEKDFILPDGARGKAPGLTGEAHHDINCRCIITVDID